MRTIQPVRSFLLCEFIRPPVGVFRCLGLGVFLLCFLHPSILNECRGQATFHGYGLEAGEHIELVRDEQLLFNQTPLRRGLKGELFQVAAHAADKQKVFLVTKNQMGSLVAVNVPDLAVRRIAHDLIGLNYKAFEAIRDGKLDEAKRAMLHLYSVDPDRSVCREIAASIDKLQKAKADQKLLLKQQDQARAEVAVKLKNAASAEIPSALTNVVNTERAERFRRDAQRVQETSDRAIKENLTTIRRELETLAGVANKLETLKAFTECSAISVFIENFSSTELNDGFHFGKRNLAMLRAAEEASRRYVIEARKALTERRLSAASDAVDKGMKAEPGSYALRKLETDVYLRISAVIKTYGKALEMCENRQFDAAVLELESSQATSTDHVPSQKLLAELKRLISEKDVLIAKAKINESLRKYELALKVYETYGLLQDRERVLDLLAAKREEEGNFIAAYEIFELQGKSEHMRRILIPKDDQEAEYRKAKLLLEDDKFDDAVAIYRKFHDSQLETETWMRFGMRLEEQAKFDEAIALYKNNGLLEELQRLKRFVNERDTLLRQGFEQEKAGNFDQAIDFFKRANALSDLKRVASAAGKNYLRRENYTSAVEYFEMAGDFDEAGRIRREYNLDEAVRRLTDEELFKHCAPACVTVLTSQSTGSGFFIKKGGYILTNNHCIEGATRVRVTTADGTTLDAKVIETSSVPDLALLKVNLKENPVLRLGDSDLVKTGIPASTIGSPQGQPQSFTKGSISNSSTLFLKNKCFMISVLINHGNSGGPLFDEQGTVIGVCTFGRGTAMVLDGVHIGSDIQGMNYAIKINEAKKVFGSTLAF